MSLTINTNLPSMVAQKNLTNSTSKLNQAIERLTTGYKINHSKDNAAGYSIAINMGTKISAYDIAGNNVASGRDLVATAMDTIALMESNLSRLHALSTQARNGTYGAQSLLALNAEAESIISSIMMTYNSASYNGISLFNNASSTIDTATASLSRAARVAERPTPKAQYNGFIENPVDYTDSEVVAMTKVSSVSGNYTSGQKYSISTAEELAKLATDVNSGKDTIGAIFVLADDIDLSAYQSGTGWTPIGNGSEFFKGTFDGNGHKVTNLKIDNTTANYQGMFGVASGATIKNVGVVDAEVNGCDYVGGLCGGSDGGSISNCYATGAVNGSSAVGGLCGVSYGSISNSYATGAVSGINNYVGGLCGGSDGGSISNCYSTGAVNGYDYVGGLCGGSYGGSISNCYATGAVNGFTLVGGLCGYSEGGSINNSYATGAVSGSDYVGGLCGGSSGSISNCYATGAVSGINTYVGGLCGMSIGSISNCYATGAVEGNGFVGGLAGQIDTPSGTLNISDCTSYSKNVIGTDTESTGSFIGGIVDDGNNTVTITDCGSTMLDGVKIIGGEYNSLSVKIGEAKEEWLSGITEVQPLGGAGITLQVGINGDDSCSITFNTNFSLDLSSILLNGIESEEAYKVINDTLSILNSKSVELGAVDNRLLSAAESILITSQNLTSSLSTIKDADVTKVSSDYIRQQILQQASATLLATANQSPSIALQLI